jgi:hypothetical protein
MSEVKQRQTLKTTEHYTIDSVWVDGDVGGTYVIVNRETGVFEMDTPIWPQALTYVKQLEDHIAKVENEDTAVVAPVLTAH